MHLLWLPQSMSACSRYGLFIADVQECSPPIMTAAKQMIHVGSCYYYGPPPLPPLAPFLKELCGHVLRCAVRAKEEVDNW